MSPTAVWAGGADGGAWVDCGMSTKEPNTTYNCKVFSERGDVLSSDSYALVVKPGSVYRPEQGPFHSIRPSFFDGCVIGLTDGRVLTPDVNVERIGNDPDKWVAHPCSKP